MENLNIPVARCNKCELDVPVDIVSMDLEDAPEELGELQLTVIICTVCENILNSNSNTKITYYDLEQLAALGWERIEDE